MNVVVFSMYYRPERSGSAPFVELPATHFAATGHQVSVVAGFPHYPEWSKASYPAVPRDAMVGGVRVLRRQHYVPSEPTAVRRALYEGSMFLGALSRVRIARRADVVIGVLPALASAYAGLLAAKFNRLPFGLVVHDLMGRGAEQSGVGGLAAASLVGAAEARLISASDQCAVLNPAFLNALPSGRSKDGAIVALPSTTSTSGAPVAKEAARAKLGLALDSTICLHAGNMGQKQGLKNVVEAAAVSRAIAPGVQYILLGDGNDAANLRRLSGDLRLSNVIFLPPADQERYDLALQSADVLVLNQRPEVEDMSYPSKLSAYLASGRPVVAAVSPTSAAASVLRDSGGGILVSPGDPEELARAVKMLADDGVLASTIGTRGLRFAAEHLTRAAMLRRYDEFLDRLAKRGP